jgi:hypothetical protein
MLSAMVDLVTDFAFSCSDLFSIGIQPAILSLQAIIMNHGKDQEVVILVRCSDRIDLPRSESLIR